MDDPLKTDRRYATAAIRGMWFAVAFVAVCTAMAVLSWAGAMGKPEDAPLLLVMAVIGVSLFIFSRFIISRFMG